MKAPTPHWWEALLVIALACAEACGLNGMPMGLPRERIVGRNRCIDTFYCSAFDPFRRGMDPQIGNVRWLVSQSGHGCVVDEIDYVMAQDGELFACDWRLARP